MTREDVIRDLGPEVYDSIEKGEIVAVTSEPSNYDERDPDIAERFCRRNGKDIECDTQDGTGYHVLYENVF